jgi:hypothetical protein
MNRRNFLKGFISATAAIALAPLSPMVELPVDDATFESIVAITLKAYRNILADSFFLKPR